MNASGVPLRDGLAHHVQKNLPDEKIFRVGIATSLTGQRAEHIAQWFFIIGKISLQLKEKAVRRNLIVEQKLLKNGAGYARIRSDCLQSLSCLVISV
jgi:hypothetical protein